MNESVGTLIEKGRKNKGLNKRELSNLVGISDTELSRIESGEREAPNPKILRKISKEIDVNYNDLMYAAGLGSQVSPLNPYLLEYYNSLKGNKLDEALVNINGAIDNNSIVIESLKISSEADDITEEKKKVLLQTIEDLEYQNDTNREIAKLLSSNIVKERLSNVKRNS